MKKLSLVLTAITLLALPVMTWGQQTMSYDRIEDLLDSMTNKDKVGQLCAYSCEPPPSPLTEKALTAAIDKIKAEITRNGYGNIVDAVKQLPLKEGIRQVNELQRHALDRCGVPLLIVGESNHGCMAAGSASFPVSLAMAATWNPGLIREAAEIIGMETRVRGIGQALSPTIDIARDPRCGRTEETYGEDPYLGSRMAAAFVQGIQSAGVIATPKHFAANFAGDGGRDSNAIHFSERLMREIFFPPFKTAVQEAGALSIMAAYNSLDGIPCHCNSWLLQDLLREEWGFNGFVVSDFTGVLGLYTRHKVAANRRQAGRLAFMAGVDVDLPRSDGYRFLLDHVEKGTVSGKELDEAVSRVLRAKIITGLFENPYGDYAAAKDVVDCDLHRAKTREVARQSLVLLKNDNRILPLEKALESIAVIGPNADEPRLGGYSAPDVRVVTPLKGIRDAVSADTKVLFARGCAVACVSRIFDNKPSRPRIVDDPDAKAGFSEALQAASSARYVVLFMGNSTETEGESSDRSDLSLPGAQEELIRAVSEVNDRVVVVLISGGVVTMKNWIDDVEAVIHAWYPGEEGGAAISDVLFGDCNPSGKLPLTYPLRTGQLPLNYNSRPSGRIYSYVDRRGSQALLPFGFGLSYTTFEFTGLEIRKTDGAVNLSFDLENAGAVAGEEVAQLYIRKTCSPITRPLKELKKFEKILLAPGETKRIEFKLTEKDLMMLDKDLKPALEPGDYEIWIGSSSEDIRLKGKIEL